VEKGKKMYRLGNPQCFP